MYKKKKMSRPGALIKKMFARPPAQNNNKITALPHAARWTPITTYHIIRFMYRPPRRRGGCTATFLQQEKRKRHNTCLHDAPCLAVAVLYVVIVYHVTEDLRALDISLHIPTHQASSRAAAFVVPICSRGGDGDVMHLPPSRLQARRQRVS